MSRSTKQPSGYRPFADLGSLLGQKHKHPPKKAPEKPAPSPISCDAPQDDEKLFRHAMAGVTPLKGKKVVEWRPLPPNQPEDRSQSEDQAVMQRLHRLVQTGQGFIVSQTPEYMEGLGDGIHPAIARWLHKGKYALQDQIDLHGFTVDQAYEAFERFLTQAIYRGHRMVLIIHGRGLSSPGQPVLKPAIRRWLMNKRWRRWIIAFSSARGHDGGAGATYVLLRRHPARRKKNAGRK